MSKGSRFTRTLAQVFGFNDPIRAYAVAVTKLDRRLARVRAKVNELSRVVAAKDARLLDHRAEVARLYYGARQAARHGSEPRALRYLSAKRQAEDRLRDLEEELVASRLLLRRAARQRDALVSQIDDLERAFESAKIVRLADDVERDSRIPERARLERARRELARAEALAQLEAGDDPFDDLPELGDEDDRLLVARWRAQDRAKAA